jgi:hypothetical protein
MENSNATKMKVLWMITDRGEKSYWTRVGVGFVNRDGSVNLQINAMPVGNSKLQLRDYTPRDAEEGVPTDDAEASPRPFQKNGNGSAKSAELRP